MFFLLELFRELEEQNVLSDLTSWGGEMEHGYSDAREEWTPRKSWMFEVFTIHRSSFKSGRSRNCWKLSFSMEAKKLKSSQGRRNFLVFLKGMGKGRGSEVCKEADGPHHVGMSQDGRMAHSYLLLTVFRRKQIIWGYNKGLFLAPKYMEMSEQSDL